MIISVCIAVYNHDVSSLVMGLCEQREKGSFPIEILLVDDCSTQKEVAFSNEKLGQLEGVFYHALSRNIGRSKIRNYFLTLAKAEYLLFLDCDSLLLREDFLSFYLSEIKRNTSGENRKLQVAYGGFSPMEKDATTLRYLYSKQRETPSLSERLANPYLRFKTINFLVQRDVLRRFPFCQKIKGYGYEDYLFAKVLEGQQIPIAHFDNPVGHCDEQSDKVFLEKIKESTRTLYLLSKDASLEPYLQEVLMYRFALSLEKKRLSFVVSLCFRLLMPLFLFCLKWRVFPLLCTDLYRISCFLQQGKRD